jgi:hypothetical protein
MRTVLRKGYYKMKDLTVNQLWYLLVKLELFTDAELKLLININGYSIETLNNAIYARYGYRDLEQMINEYDD